MANILIAGGSGLIGQQLSNFLAEAGHQIAILSRNPQKVKTYTAFFWDPMAGKIDEAALEGVDYVINLAGAGIADKRWTARRKQLIIESRTATAALFLAQIKAGFKPKAYIAASAIGFYGNRGSEELTESSAAGTGFLSESVQAWEEASQSIANSGIPTTIVRIGIVLSTKGGALAKMIASYPFKVGSYFGNGKQMYSWVHITDILRLFLFLINQPKSLGIINAVADHPVSNKVMAHAINTSGDFRALIVPAPKLALRMTLGEMADVVLDSTNVSNQKLKQLGFDFSWPTIEPALKDLFEKQR